MPALRVQIPQVKDGCSEHGQVLEVFVDRESALGRVVVKFANSDAASSCQKAMNGRLFAGQQVASYTLSEGEFEQFWRRGNSDKNSRVSSGNFS